MRKQQANNEKEKVNCVWSVCITSNRRKNAVNNNLACLMNNNESTTSAVASVETIAAHKANTFYGYGKADCMHMCMCVCVCVYSSCNCLTVVMRRNLTASIGF